MLASMASVFGHAYMLFVVFTLQRAVEDVTEGRISHPSDGLDRTRRLWREIGPSFEKWEIDLCFIKSH